MSDRRRLRFARPIAGAVGLLAAAAVASAQPPPPAPGVRVPLNTSSGLSPDQLKQALSRLGMAGGVAQPPQIDAALRDRLAKQFPNLPKEQLDAAAKKITGDPATMKDLADRVRREAAGQGGVPPGPNPRPANGPPGDGGRDPAGEGAGGKGEPEPDRQADPARPAPKGVPQNPKTTSPGNPQPRPGTPPPFTKNDGPPAKNTPPGVTKGGQPPADRPPPNVLGGPKAAGDPNPKTPPVDRPPEAQDRAPRDDAPPPPPPVQAPPPADGPPGLDGPETPKEKALRTAGAMWERNVGPLDDTPAVKSFLFDLVEGTDGLTDGDGKSLWDSLSKEVGSGGSFTDFLDGAAAGNSWSLPEFNFPSLGLGGGPKSDPAADIPDAGGESWWSRNFGGSRPRTPSAPSAPRGGLGIDFGVPALEGSWLPVVLLAAVLIGGLIWWRFWYLKDDRPAVGGGLGGLGPWPVDPRRITTRADVTRAFEYLSVLVCGPAAKTWTHHTIAQALTDLVETHGEAAVLLARLYELARYTPADEPLTTTELAEARRLVCRLAGLDAE